MAETTDRWGAPVAGAETAVGMLDDAVAQLVGLHGDPVAAVEAAIAEDPRLVLARVLRAYLSLYGTGSDGFAEARAVLADLESADLGDAERLPAREALHLRAARAWAAGHWEGAARFLEHALLLEPRDLLALKVAQDLYFFVGNRLELRDTVARVLPSWSQERPGWGYVQGMYAFGLEENADYPAAEQRARAALGAEARDVWATHALAHVFEMEGRQRDGIEFLTGSAPDWRDSFFAVHNWWHRALYHLELDEVDEVLSLYDGPIRAAGSTSWLDVVDGASLIWRLHLFGVDVEARARALFSDIDGNLGEPVYVFNDWHALMAAALVGRDDVCGERIAESTRAVGTNRLAIEAAGLDLMEGFRAFAAGDPARALDRLVDVRARAHVVGGSHAQRDVIDLTLLAAAARAGNDALARALVAERAAKKPSAEPAARRLVEVNRDV